MRLTAVLSFLTLASFVCKAELPDPIPSGCGQIVLVIAPDWNASTATLRRFSRSSIHEPWSPVGDAVTVLLGESGLGWAAGLRPVPEDLTPRKAEGDRRSPAGFFLLTEVFSHEKIEGSRMPSITLTPGMEAIDDPRSRFYNQIVDRRKVENPDWHSSERMAEIHAYEVGIVVGANPARQPGAGSCIFLHLWTRTPNGTAGCTALHRADLLTLVRWLDPSQRPILIQLPKDAARDLPAPLKP